MAGVINSPDSVLVRLIVDKLKSEAVGEINIHNGEAIVDDGQSENIPTTTFSFGHDLDGVNKL